MTISKLRSRRSLTGLLAGLLALTGLALTDWRGPASAGAAHRCDGKRATIVGTDRSDKLVGTRGPDVIAGLGGNDVLKGLGGRDVLCGAGGSDLLYGGPGSDRLSGGLDGRTTRSHQVILYGDSFWGGPGNDHIEPGWDPNRGHLDLLVPDLLRYDTATRGVRVNVKQRRATGQGRDTVTSSSFGVVGSRFDDTVSGGPGPDYVLTGRGSDEVATFEGKDRVWLEGQPQSYTAAEIPVFTDRKADDAPDTARVGPGRDRVYSRGGEDTIGGGGGSDTLTDDGTTPDIMSGGAGTDAMFHNMLYDESGLVLAGGAGSGDTIVWEAPQPWPGPGDTTTMNLTSGELTFTEQGGVVISHVLLGFENSDGGRWGELTLVATDDDNTLFLEASGGSVHTLSGDDYISIFQPTGMTIDGGDGFDRLAWADCAVNTCISIEANFFP